MSGGGHIVNTASMAGLYPGLIAPYDATKHAVVALTENLYNSMQVAQLPIGVSCLCPGWVKTGISQSERNWPAEFGDVPERDAIQDVGRAHFERAIDEGMQPAAVADLVVDAVRTDRYWIFPHPDWLEIAMERFHSVGEASNPSPPEEFPGMPPRSQMLAEMMAVMEAMAPPE
jgi:NAD(P)-dependent dehydrogenase (short-subunit alcohol dehydrogenase family)